MTLPASSLHFLPLPSSSVMSHQACLWVPTLFSLFFFPLLHPRSGWYEYSCGFSHCSHTDNSSISIFSPDLFSEYQTYSDAWWEPHLQLLWSWVSCHPLQSCPLPRFPWWVVGMLAGVPSKITLAPFPAGHTQQSGDLVDACSFEPWNLTAWLLTATTLVQHLTTSHLYYGTRRLGLLPLKFLLLRVLVLLQSFY